MMRTLGLARLALDLVQIPEGGGWGGGEIQLLCHISEVEKGPGAPIPRGECMSLQSPHDKKLDNS